jgi:hypothetical protein
MKSSRISAGAHDRRPRKAVRFSFEVEEIESEYFDQVQLSTEYQEQRDRFSRDASEILDAPVNTNVRPSSPPIRKREIQLLDLTGQIIREHKFPAAHGGFADVWTGILHKGSVKAKVGGQSGNDNSCVVVGCLSLFFVPQRRSLGRRQGSSVTREQC